MPAQPEHATTRPDRDAAAERQDFKLPWRFLQIAGAALAVLHIYIGARLLPDLPIGVPLRGFAVALLIVSWVAMPAGMMARFVVSSQTLADRLTWVGMLAMGLFSWLLVATLVRDAVLAGLFVGDNLTVSLKQQSAFAAGGVALLATFAGFLNARRIPRIVDVTIPVPGLPGALEGFTIVQISDLHIGPTIKGDFLARVVDRVNRLNADIIAVTGDVIDGSVEQLAPEVAPLAKLKARHGAYFVTGNHEYYSDAPSWIAEMRRLGLTVLDNQHVVIAHGDAAMVLAGVPDYSAHHFPPARKSDPHAAIAGAPAHAGVRALLAHQPRSAEAAEAAGFDLQLSGHTHGGQFWPWNHFVRLQQPYTAGLHRLDRLWVYVSRGTGYWGPPLRLGAPSEITRLRLVRPTR